MMTKGIKGIIVHQPITWGPNESAEDLHGCN